jgi:hypothetical protein
MISGICRGLILALSLAPFFVLPAPVAATGTREVIAQYYAWFDQNSWGPSRVPDQPAQPYNSADRATIDRQVTQAQQSGIDAFALDWWGPGNPTDSNLQTLLSVAAQHGFKVTITFDQDSPFVHNTGDIVNDLNYASRYFSSPAWFHYNGKPVVAFYGTRKYDVGTWSSIRGMVGSGQSAIWLAEGDLFQYLSVFDGIYPYSIAWSPDPASQLADYGRQARAYPGKLWVATVMPGYNDTLLGRPNGFWVDRQGGAYYTSVWQGAIASQPDLVSITSWNEWPEGSQIEPSTTYGNLYLQLTRQEADRFHAASSSSGGTSEFFAQAGQGRGGYRIADDGNAAFDRAFESLGGVGALGYPASQRFTQGGFLYQATQGAVLQWRPELGDAVLANTFDWFTQAGKDEWLASVASVPVPIKDDGSGGNWEAAKQTRLGWLTDPGIRSTYLAVGSVDRAIELYGLPASYPEQRGPFVIQRFQRIAFQRWTDSVPGMPPPGSVVRVLAGDYLKEAGIIPASAQQPTPN